jgi:hypothetical protein
MLAIPRQLTIGSNDVNNPIWVAGTPFVAAAGDLTVAASGFTDAKRGGASGFTLKALELTTVWSPLDLSGGTSGVGLTIKTSLFDQNSTANVKLNGGNFTLWATNTAQTTSIDAPIVTAKFGADILTNGGNITVKGGPLTTDPVQGDLPIKLAASELNAGSGSISIYAKVLRNDSLTNDWTQVGIAMVPSGTATTTGSFIKTTGSGGITINVLSDTGKNTHVSAGILMTNGVDQSAGYSQISTVDGPIDITVKAFDHPTTGKNAVTYGLALTHPVGALAANYSLRTGYGTALMYVGIKSTGTGSVTIDADAGKSNSTTGSKYSFTANSSPYVAGTTSSNNSTQFQTVTAGVFVGGASSFITSANGPLVVKGRSYGEAGKALIASFGVLNGNLWGLGTSSIIGASNNTGQSTNTATGSVEITGWGGETGNGGESTGLNVLASNYIYANSGSTTLEGHGADLSGLTINSVQSFGIWFSASGAQSSKSGNLTIKGYGGNVSGSGSAGKLQSSGFVGPIGSSTVPVKGTIDIIAQGGNVTTDSAYTGGTPRSYGWRAVNGQSYIAPTSPALIKGTSGTITTWDDDNISTGISIEDSLTNSGAGSLTLEGTGGLITSNLPSTFKSISAGIYALTGKTWDSTAGGDLNFVGKTGGITTLASKVLDSLSYGMFGIRNEGSAFTASAGGGGIKFQGYGPVPQQGIDLNANSFGIYLKYTATSAIATLSGPIWIEGDAGTSSDGYQGASDMGLYGLYVEAGVQIGSNSTINSSANLTIKGTGGAATTTGNAKCAGIYASGKFKTSSGFIKLDGTGCSNAGSGSAGVNYGIRLMPALSLETTTGNIEVLGTSGLQTGGADKNPFVVGVMAANLFSTSNNVTMSTTTGNITVEGKNAPGTDVKPASNAALTQFNSVPTGVYGVYLGPTSTSTISIKSTNAGLVKIKGTGTNAQGAAGVWLGGPPLTASTTLTFTLDSTNGQVVVEGLGVGAGGFGVGLGFADSAPANITKAKIGELSAGVTVTGTGSSSGKGTSANPSAGLYIAGYQTIGGGSAPVTINTNSYYAFGALATAQLPLTLGTSGAFSLLPIGSDFANQFAFDKSTSAANTPIELSLTTSSTPTASTVWTVGKAGVTKNLKLISDISLGTAGTFKFLGGSLVQSSAKVLADKVGLQVSGPVWMNNANSIGTVAISSTDPSSINFINGRSTWTAGDVGGITAVYGIPVELSIVPTQPTTGSAGVALASDIKIGSKDFYGYAVASENTTSNNIGTVTAALATSPNGSTLSGTTSATVSSGVATFSNIIGDLAGDYTITFSATGFTSVTSSTISLTVAKVAQTTLVLVTTTQTGPYNSTIALSTSGGDGTGAVTYAVGAGENCTISGSTLTLASNAGTTCSVTATKATDNSYYAASSAPVSFSITKADQAALTVTSITGAYGSTMSLTSSGGTTNGVVTFVKDSVGCSLTGSSLSLNSNAGTTCEVTATMAGNTNYNAVSSSSTSISITKANQATLSVSNTSGRYNETITLATTGGTSAGAVTYTVTSGSSNCSLTNDQLTLVGNATTNCSVTATMAGGTNYNDVTSSARTITINKANQVITVPVATVPYGGSLDLSSLTWTGAQGQITFASNEGLCTVSSSTVSPNLRSAGTNCVLTYSVAGTSNYNAVNTTSFYVGVVKADQSALSISSTSGSYGSSLTLTTSGGSTAGAVTFVKDSGLCSLTSNSLTLSSDAGTTCSVTATMAGSANYNPVSSSSTTITINKANQSALTVTSTSGAYNSVLGLTVSGGTTGGAVTFVKDSAGCSLTGSDLTLNSNAGTTCAVTATMAGNANYNAVSSTSTSITISRATQSTISVTSAASVTWGTNLTLTYSGGNSTASAVWSATGSNCSVSGNTLSSTGGGDCVVRVTLPQDTNYTAITSADFTVTLNRQSQAQLTWNGSLPSSIDYLASQTLSVNGGSGTGAIVYSASNLSTCSVASNIVTAGDAGSLCRVVATKLGDDDYLSVDSSYRTFTINQIAQASVSLSNANTFVYGQTLNLLATGGSGEGALSYTISSAGSAGCSIANGTVSATNSGTCVVGAQRLSSTNYQASASSTQTITVTTAPQSITFTSTIPITPVAGGTYAIAATASSGLNVSFSTASSACSVSNGTVSFTTSGTCVVTAAQAGDNRFDAASSITQTIVIGSRNQTLTFSSGTLSLTSKTFGAPAFVVSATSTESDAVLTYSLSSDTTNSACAVTSSGVVVIQHVGTCAVDVDAAGTSSYVAASTITKVFSVVPDVASAPFISSTSAGNRAMTASFLPPSYVGGSNVTSYVLRAVDQTNGSTTVLSQTGCSATLIDGQASCTVTGLDNGVSYRLQVAAVTDAGIGQYSDLSEALIAATNPAAVQQLIVSEGNGTLTISWADPDTLGGGTFTEYRIFIKPSTQSNYDQAHYWTSSPMNVRSKTVSALTPGGTALVNGAPYDVKIVTVTAANSAELTANTTQVNKIPRTVPDAPVVAAPVVAGTELLIAWEVPVSDGGAPIQNYTVTFNGAAVNAAQPTDTYLLLPAPTSDGHYPYNVVAVNAAGSSDPATGSFVVANGTGNGTPSDNTETVENFQRESRAVTVDPEVSAQATAEIATTPGAAPEDKSTVEKSSTEDIAAQQPENSNQGMNLLFWMIVIAVLTLCLVLTTWFIRSRR